MRITKNKKPTKMMVTFFPSPPFDVFLSIAGLTCPCVLSLSTCTWFTVAVVSAALPLGAPICGLQPSYSHHNRGNYILAYYHPPTLLQRDDDNVYRLSEIAFKPPFVYYYLTSSMRICPSCDSTFT